MAKQLNIEPATYSKIETGRTRLAVDMLEKIANILEISPLALLNKDVLVNSEGGNNTEWKARSLTNEATAYDCKKLLNDIIDVVKDAEIASLKNTVQIQQKLLQQQLVIIEKLGAIK